MTNKTYIPIGRFQSMASIMASINEKVAGKNIQGIFFNPKSLFNGTVEVITEEPQTIEIEKIVEKLVQAPEPAYGKGNGTSRYRGVYWDKAAKKWRAQFAHEGKKQIKRFETELEAAEQYDLWAFEKLGHKAYLNFPKKVVK